MGSSYPGSLDVFQHIADEFDRPSAPWFNRLFDALYKVQTELGADPSDLGTGYTSVTDLADVLLARARIEAGTFTIEMPSDSPVEVLFKNDGTSGRPQRFTDASKLIVLIDQNPNNKGRRTGENKDVAVEIIVDGASVPIGFSFYRFNLTAADDTEEWRYLAWEDAL
jgi:hypothetical protein